MALRFCAKEDKQNDQDAEDDEEEEKLEDLAADQEEFDDHQLGVKNDRFSFIKNESRSSSKHRIIDVNLSQDINLQNITNLCQKIFENLDDWKSIKLETIDEE